MQTAMALHMRLQIFHILHYMALDYLLHHILHFLYIWITCVLNMFLHKLLQNELHCLLHAELHCLLHAATASLYVFLPVKYTSNYTQG
jgi:hypothetical protein